MDMQKPIDQQQPRKGRGKLIWRFLKGSKALFLLCMACSALASLAEMIIPHDKEALICHPSAEMIIAIDKFLHSVRDLQDVLGFATPQAIYKWQRGTCLPSVDNLVVLSAVLRVPIDKILVIEESSRG